MRKVAPLLLLAAVSLATACGGADSPGGEGSVLTVPEALATSPGGSFAVRGTLIADGADVRLCYAIAESYPPQCGRPSLRLDGADLSALPDLDRAQGVTWSNREVTVLGELEDGVLTVSQTGA